MLHIAKVKLGLSDEDYRNILRSCGEVKSAKELDRLGFNSVLSVFKELGFTPSRRGGRKYAEFDKPEKRSRRGGELRMIEALWADIYDKPDAPPAVRLADLRKFIKREHGVDHITFLNAEQRWQCIEALKAMRERRSMKKLNTPGTIAE